MRRVAIVGGGISGLALAERLAAMGVEPVVLESSATAGGKIATVEKGGFLLEAGPNGFLDKEPATLALAERVGLGASLRPATPAASKRWIHLRGALREVPQSPPAFLRSDLLPWWAKARLALEPFSRRSKEEDESIASFGRRHLGRRATRDLLSAMVLGIFAGDVESLSLRACFPRMAALEEEHRSLILAMMRLRGGGAPPGALTSVEGGLGALVSAVADHLGPAVHTGVRVASIDREAAGVRLLTEGPGGQQEVRADAVAICAPAYEAARLLAPHDERVAELAKGIAYAPMAVVHLGWPREMIGHQLDGFGFLIPPHENHEILGTMFISSIFPWRAPADHVLFTTMVGGAVAPHLIENDDAALIQLAVAEVSSIVEASGSPGLAEVVRWERAIPQYLVGHTERVREVDGRMANIEGIHLGGNAWKGVGVNDCIREAGVLAEQIVRGPV